MDAERRDIKARERDMEMGAGSGSMVMGEEKCVITMITISQLE